jgi:hypothetical protein
VFTAFAAATLRTARLLRRWRAAQRASFSGGAHRPRDTMLAGLDKD